ncbi:MAG: hypothetical protein IJT25_03320 [Clostridia bacterium]|nr:hypothetical protein [Clostridia bacterium]
MKREMKNLHKNSFNFTSIIASIAIMFVSLFSLISSLRNLYSTPLINSNAQQNNAISNYAEISASENKINELKTDLTSALNFVVISQTGFSLNENNFKQLIFSTITPSTEPEEDWNKNEDLKNIVYVVGSFTILPQLDSDGNIKESSVSITKINPTTLVRSTQSAPTEPETENITFDSEDDYKTIPSLLSGDMLYEITVSYSLASGEPPIVTDYSHTFYVYQAPNLNYENYGINWKKYINNSATNISSPVENQIYDSGYSSDTANEGYVALELNYAQLKDNLTTNLNSLYIDFWHNGQSFSIRIENNVEGLDFYNNHNPNLSSSLIVHTGSGNKTIKTEDGKLSTDSIKNGNIYSIKFIESGEYKVRIYDNTLNRLLKTSSTNEANETITTYSSLNNTPTTYSEGDSYNIYKNANYIEHNFTVVNRSKLNGFYATAKTQDTAGNLAYIVTEIDHATSNMPTSYPIERTNKNVVLDFYNLYSIEKISYTQYAIANYGVSKSDIPLTFTSNTDHIQTTVTDDGNYFYDIEFKNDYHSNIATFRYKTICFQLLKGVRSQYDFEGKHYPEAEDIVEINKVLTKNLSQTFTATTSDMRNFIYFEGLGDAFLFGVNNNTFDLNIAESRPSISAIAKTADGSSSTPLTNNKSTTDIVDLSITGVATSDAGMLITVYKDGSKIFENTIYNNDSQNALTYTLSYSDLGSYRVVLTDAMRSSTELRFSITKTQNAAGIILIVIAIAAVAVVIFMIIRIRSKVAVR